MGFECYRIGIDLICGKWMEDFGIIINFKIKSGYH